MTELMNDYSDEFAMQILAMNNKEFNRALRNDASGILQQFLQLQSGVINVWGSPGSNRHATAEKLAYLLQKNVQYTFDYENGWNDIHQDTILIVESGSVLLRAKDSADDYGAEQYQTFALKRHGIVIIISRIQIAAQYLRFSVRTLGYSDKPQIVKGMLYSENLPVGVVQMKLVDDHNWQNKLESVKRIAKIQFTKTEIDKIFENLSSTTSELVNALLVKKSIIFAKQKIRSTENAIIPVKILVYGDVGAGKSTLLEIIFALLQQNYGTEHVHGTLHENDLGIMLQDGFVADVQKYCQYLAIEDATYKLPSDSDVAHDWINLRHIMNEATGGTRENRSTGIQQAVVYVALALHRLTGAACGTEFRTSFHFQFFLDLPTSKWDRNYIKDLFASNVYYDFLEQVISAREAAKLAGDTQRYLELLGVGVCITKNGFFPFRLNLDTYSTAAIPLLDKTMSWRDDWQDLALQLFQRFQNTPKIPGYVIDHYITMEDLAKYGRIRTSSESKIKYRTRVINMVRTLRFMHQERTQNPVTSTLPEPYTPIDGTDFLEMDSIYDIMYSLLLTFSSDISMSDYLLRTQGKSFNEIVNVRNISKATLGGNIKRIQRKLTQASGTGGIGFLFEQAVFILAYNLLHKHFGGVTLELHQNNEVQTFDKLVLRDYKLHRNSKFILYPPAHNLPEKSPLPSFEWLGGLSAADFLCGGVEIECKASAAIQNSKNPCDCVIDGEKIHDDFQGGWILHFHPWHFVGEYFDSRVSRSLKTAADGHHVLRSLLLPHARNEKSKGVGE